MMLLSHVNAYGLLIECSMYIFSYKLLYRLQPACQAGVATSKYG
jgi:hypothetical protein